MRVKARWGGFSGAPGYTVLHLRDFGAETGVGNDPDAVMAQQAVDKVYAGFQRIQTLLPTAVTINMEQEVEIIEDTNGELVDSIGTTSPVTLNGTSSSTWSAASGAVISWKTNGIRKGRRIRGRSFLVPLSGSAYDGTGRLSGSAVTQIQSMATLLADSTTTPDLGVYARPTAKGATDGQWSVVSTGNVTNLGAILTSRRD